MLQEEGKPQRSVLAEDFFLGYRSALLHCTGLLVCALSSCWCHWCVMVGGELSPSVTAAMHARSCDADYLSSHVSGRLDVFCCTIAGSLP